MRQRTILLLLALFISLANAETGVLPTPQASSISAFQVEGELFAAFKFDFFIYNFSMPQFGLSWLEQFWHLCSVLAWAPMMVSICIINYNIYPFFKSQMPLAHRSDQKC
jgi:hypothetical protein